MTPLASLASRLFTPAAALVGRLRFARKFALIGVVMLAPLVWVVRAYVNVQSDGTSVATQEQVGLAYLRPLTTLLFDVIESRSVAVQTATHELPQTALPAAKARIAQAIASVDAAPGAARALKLTAGWAATRARLERLLAGATGSPIATFAAYNGMATAIESLIAADGNNSNMILDPDDDSYYLMDAVLNRLTVLADSAGRGADLQSVLAAAGNATLAQRLALEDLKGTIATTLSNSDPDYASALHNTHYTSMRALLAPSIHSVDVAMAAVTGQLSTAVTGRASPADAHRLAAAAEARALALDHATFPVTGHLLVARIDGFDDASTTTELGVLLAVLLAAYLFVGFYLSVRRSQQTIQDGLVSLQEGCIDPLGAGLDATATGDLTTHLHASAAPIDRLTRDELGDVAVAIDAIRLRIVDSIASFNAMCEQLRRMITDVSSSAVVAGTASREVSSAAEDAGRATGDIVVTAMTVAQGAERQVMMIGEAERMAGEVTRAARDSATSAHESAEQGQRTRRDAGDGLLAVEQADAAMRGVEESAATVTAAIRELAAKSTQIDEIMGTIIAIAEQTNLLALNAAIEAARAGEHGRGFAVVADQVKKLADESQDAAGHINRLIQTIQSDTNAAVAVVESGARQTENGVAIVGQTKDAFVRIDASVQAMTARIEEIAQFSETIVASADRMQETIGEIAAVAQQSSASTQEVTASTEESSAAIEQMAASAHELAGTAGSLEQLVAQFRTV